MFELFIRAHALIIIYSNQSSKLAALGSTRPVTHYPRFLSRATMCKTSLSKQTSCFHARMTRLSGFALNVEASLKLPATIYFSMLFCCLLARSAVSQAAGNVIEIQSHPRPPPLPSLSPDSVWHSVGLVAVALAVAGVLWPAGGTLVPPQSHRPVGEHRDAFGNAPAGLGREQCEAETLGHFQRYFLTAEVQGNTGERERLPAWKTVVCFKKVHNQGQWKCNKAQS